MLKENWKKPGCPCKDDGRKCIPACLCGKKKHGKMEKPCKNGKVCVIYGFKVTYGTNEAIIEST